MKTAIRDNNPVIFLENEIMYGKSFDVPDVDDFTIPFGKAKIEREGTDVTIVSFGIGMTYALAAADKLAEDGISAEVINLRTMRPMDTETILASVSQNEPLCDRRRRLAAGLCRWTISVGCDHARGVRLSRRTCDHPDRQRRADAICREP